jgi:hypothetical protein
VYRLSHRGIALHAAQAPARELDQREHHHHEPDGDAGHDRGLGVA